RTRRVALHLPGKHSDRADVLCEAAPDAGAWGFADSARAQYAAAARRKAANGNVPDAIAGLHVLHRRDPLRSGHAAEDHRRDDPVPALRARKPGDRPRPGRLDGTEETRGLLLGAGRAETTALRAGTRREPYATRQRSRGVAGANSAHRVAPVHDGR